MKKKVKQQEKLFARYIQSFWRLFDRLFSLFQLIFFCFCFILRFPIQCTSGNSYSNKNKNVFHLKNQNKERESKSGREERTEKWLQNFWFKNKNSAFSLFLYFFSLLMFDSVTHNKTKYECFFFLVCRSMALFIYCYRLFVCCENLE